MNTHSHAALILVGHGSTVNPDSSAPTHRHADTVRERGLFREVACCFWKEEPNMLEVFEMVDSEVIYIVPNFISEGYFCQQVLPRELRVAGPITQRDGRTLYYCDPVGIHPNMTRLLLQRADEVAAGVPRGETSLVIVGHGTNLNENSTKAIQDQVKLIREGGHGFAEVLDAYMEEAPFVADWHTMTTAPNVVVVPFFIADGLHSYQDIPVLLGMETETGKALSESDVFRHNPIELHGRHLYFSGAIGTEPLMAEVIMDQVNDFDRKHAIAPVAAPAVKQNRFAHWFEGNKRVIGQIAVKAMPHGGYRLCHLDDLSRVDSAELVRQKLPAAARELAINDDAGVYRPIKTAPTLRHGWRLDLRNLEELVLALDFFYPAALGMLLAQNTGTLEPVPLRHLLSRQTGMYRFANGITDEQANKMISRCCETQTRCLRRITWGMTADEPMSGPAVAKLGDKAGVVAGHADALPLLCMEACNHIVSEARKISRENSEARKAATSND